MMYKYKLICVCHIDCFIRHFTTTDIRNGKQ